MAVFPCVNHAAEARNRGRERHARSPNTPSDGSDSLFISDID